VELRQKIERNSGLLVGPVRKDGSAWESNVIPGDVLLKIGNTEIISVDQCAQVLSSLAGTEVSLTLFRGDRMVEVKVPLNPLQPENNVAIPALAVQNNKSVQAEGKDKAPSETHGFEIDLSKGVYWSGNYSVNGEHAKLKQPVIRQVLPIVTYVGGASETWQLSVFVAEGAITVYEVVADDAKGTNVKRVSMGISADAANPLIFLNYLGNDSERRQ
jgi:hypothetical protein